MKQPGIPQEHHENHRKNCKKYFSVNLCVSSVRSGVTNREKEEEAP